MSMVKTRLAIASFTVATILCIVGMLLPPIGDIAGNVLIAMGQFLILTATLLGVSDAFDKIHNLVKRKNV